MEPIIFWNMGQVCSFLGYMDQALQYYNKGVIKLKSEINGDNHSKISLAHFYKEIIFVKKASSQLGIAKGKSFIQIIQKQGFLGENNK